MDKKDLQLLELLGKNCRLPYSTLARALNLSKDTVRNRILRLENEKVITHYNTIVDIRTLGFSKFHLLIKLKGRGLIEEKQLSQLISHPAVSFMNSFTGKYDLQIIVDTRNAQSFEEIKSELLAILGDTVQDYITLAFLFDLKHNNLLPETSLNTPYHKELDSSFSSLMSESAEVERDYKIYQFDTLDVKIISLLCNDPRISLVDLSEKLRYNRETLKQRIAKLIRSGVIRNFGANPSFEKFDYVPYFLLVKSSRQLEGFELKKIRGLTNLFYAACVQGSYSSILYLVAKSPTHLKETLMEIKSIFGESLIELEFLLFDALYQYTQFPKHMSNYLLSVASK